MGKKIYDERYRQTLEPEQTGKFLAIDIESGESGIGDTSVDAMAAGKKAAPGGFFYLVRVGYPTPYRSSFRMWIAGAGTHPMRRAFRGRLIPAKNEPD